MLSSEQHCFPQGGQGQLAWELLDCSHPHPVYLHPRQPPSPTVVLDSPCYLTAGNLRQSPGSTGDQPGPHLGLRCVTAAVNPADSLHSPG